MRGHQCPVGPAICMPALLVLRYMQLVQPRAHAKQPEPSMLTKRYREAAQSSRAVGRFEKPKGKCGMY